VLSEDFPAQLGVFQAGSLVAGYRLEAQVGIGGMAVVFRARDERLGRLVALKIMTPTLAADGPFRKRFIAESRAAAAVDDPHIIPVYEAGEADGALFIAMRFVQGGDLRRVLDREGKLPPDRAAAFISPVASALDAAHRAGLVHRDVKPANILVDAREDRPDHVYLSDFGVSKGAATSTGMTGTGHFLGTPDYSAPEQIQGRVVDGRTDQYALACVAYQLLTGTVPFERDQGMAVLLAHMSEPPPSLRSRRPDLAGPADQVLARAMAKAPEHRYASCRDFADALRAALGLTPYISRGSIAAPGPPRPQAAGPIGFTGSVANGSRVSDPGASVTIDALPPAAGLPARRRPAELDTPGDGPTGPASSQRSGIPETVREPVGLDEEPSGPAARAYATGGATAGPAHAIPSRARRGHREVPGPRRRRPIIITSLLVLVALIIGGAYVGLQSTQGQYYLAAANGQVVVYQGVNYEFLWFKLYHVYEQTGIPLAQVPTNYQQTVISYPPGNLAHVQSAAVNIDAAVTQCHLQYTQLRNWVARENRYQVELAEANRVHKPASSIANPGPTPSIGPFCQPSQAYGIPASALSPTPAGHS
jgi:hypothetical protein